MVPACAGTAIENYTFGATSNRTIQFSNPGFRAG
jgi:hypothetical protein